MLAMLSIALYAWQYWAGARFRFRNPATTTAPLPGISLLKPIGSVDDFTLKCLASWIDAGYPGDRELLLGVDATKGDDAARLERLLATNDNANARVIRCVGGRAANPKVSKLLELLPAARHEVLLISDADVLVESDFLIRFTGEFLQSEAALSCCLYRLQGGSGLAQKLESSANNIEFWSQVAQAGSMSAVDFALGAAMILKRDALESIGGFAAFGDHIADDFQLGNRLRRHGGTILVSSAPVDCLHSSPGARDILQRQVRWARTMRICKPLTYFFSILSNPTLWPMVWWLAEPIAPERAGILAGWLLLRILLARDLARRFLESNATGGIEWLTPIRDLLHAPLWIAAFTGSTVSWAGRRYRLSRAGSMIPTGAKP